MKTHLLLMLCLLTFTARAQDLLSSRQSSPFTYIYRITDEEAAMAYEADYWFDCSPFLHTLVDSFYTDSLPALDLPQGHYLKTTIHKGELKVSMTTVSSFNIAVLNNSADLAIAVQDTLGQVLQNAVVKVGRKRICFDAKTQLYHLRKANKKGTLTVEYNGFKTWHSLSRQWNNPAWKRTLKAIPLRYIWHPVQFVALMPTDAVRSIKRHRPQRTIYQTRQFFVKTWKGAVCLLHRKNCKKRPFEEGWKGYLVFNKPKYLPGDTVKYKAFVTDRKGRPLQDSVAIVLSKSYQEQRHIARLAPYAPGGFSGEFVLHDSFALQLDKDYFLLLQKEKGKTYLSGSFQYEDYELRSIALDLRSNTERHFRGQDFEIFLKGTDENNLNLADARVEIVLRPLKTLAFHESELFIPDTLWQWKEALEPSGETAISIPDSIFPAIDVLYELSIVMLTSDNERLEKKESYSFYHQLEELTFELQNDSIRFMYQKNGKSLPKQALLAGHDLAGNTVAERLVNLPHQEKLNTQFEYYQLETDRLREQLNIRNEPSLLHCAWQRDADSIQVLVQNPRRIPFRYFIYELNREIARGYGTSLNWKHGNVSKHKYQVVLQYLWGGRVKDDYYESSFDPNQLRITIEKPDLVYPGQTSEISVKVSDQKGEAVAGVDLTAYGLTEKFKPVLPYLPTFTPSQRSRRAINSFMVQSNTPKDLWSRFDFSKWRERAGLDTIEYYRFLFPARDVYRFEATAPDSATQFSPFVVHKGQVQKVHVVYLDQKPVYFSWSQNERPYAFRAEPGYHRVALRTDDRLYEIDSLYIPANRKLIFSIGDSVQSQHVAITAMKSNELNDLEKSNLYRYVFPYRYTFGNELAYLKQGEEVLLLQPRGDLRGRRNYDAGLAGPVMPNTAEFVLSRGYQTSFVHEPFFEYEFSKGLLKMREYNMEKRYLTTFSGNAIERFKDWAFSESYLLSQRQLQLDEIRKEYLRYSYPATTLSGKGRLQVLPAEKTNAPEPLNVLLLHLEDATFLRVYPSQTQEFHDLRPGTYRVVWLYADDQYIILDSIKVQSNGLTCRRLENPIIQPRDSFSMRVNELLEAQLFQLNPSKTDTNREIMEIKNAYQTSISWSGPGRIIEGHIRDETGEPLMGASVGTKNGLNATDTDLNGYYRLFIPEGESDTIVIDYIGYSSLMITDIGDKSVVDVVMDGIQSIILSEVTVVDYSVPFITQDNTTAGMVLTSDDIENLPALNINALASLTAGLSSGDEGSSANVRGSRADAMVYYIDGVRVQGELVAELDRGSIANVEVVSGESATAVFGAAAINGVVLITTKKGAAFDADFLAAAGEASSIRSNFSDYAFWQPRLRTDAAGKAVFKVTFPDDITNWRTFVLAMNGNKQVGRAESNIRSFKPLAARLSLPRFLVEGDSAWAIGKLLNYTPDTMALRAGFAIGNAETKLRDYKFADAVTDSLLLAPITTDSLQVKFVLEKSDGYTDGEQRSIAVLPRGLERSLGQFAALNGDTTLQWSFADSLGAVTLYARADMLEVLEEEIARLVHYEYDCNEQMASRLKALLAEAQIAAFKGADPKKDAARKVQMQKLIERLEKNQNDQQLWGWWNRSATSFWISTHVLEALAQARKMGYPVQIAMEKIRAQAVWELESTIGNARKLELLYLLRSFDSAWQYEPYLRAIEKDSTLSVANRFRLLELQQMCGLAWNRDSLEHYRKETLFGNLYFEGGGNAYSLASNTLQLTLSAYRILQRDSLPDKAKLARIRNYFLEKRARGQWNNTYETAQIIAAILPDLQMRGSSLQAPVLQLGGSLDTLIRNFPYQTTIAPNEPLTITKTGDYPIYFTAYQQYWDVAPRENSKHFKVETAFTSGGDHLRAGKPERLDVMIEVYKDAEYVMIEVPIPAACSYENKGGYAADEVHRESFRDKTSIFCESLKAGKYTFSINLLPRYAGTFTLNPAKVELMYFPVFEANNLMRKVEVE